MNYKNIEEAIEAEFNIPKSVMPEYMTLVRMSTSFQAVCGTVNILNFESEARKVAEAMGIDKSDIPLPQFLNAGKFNPLFDLPSEDRFTTDKIAKNKQEILKAMKNNS